MGCNQCANAICGQSGCKQCSSPEKFERPIDMCYSSLSRKVKCNSDPDCQLWQVCLYKYRNQEDLDSWQNEYGYCVDASRQITVDEANAEKDNTDEVKTKEEHLKADTSKCVSSRKKLVVDVDKSGFGNRILGLLSAIFLAVKTDRILFLKWTPDNRKCGSSFKDLFETDYLQKSPHQAFFLWNESDRVTNFHKIVHDECILKFDQSSNLDNYHFMTDISLFQKMQDECELIYVQANRYFGHLLYTIDHENHGDYLTKLLGPTPLTDLSKCMFQIREHIRKEADEFVKKLRAHGPYMSLHIRSVYTNKYDIQPAIECANHMLKSGVIKKLFLATDFDQYQTLARSFMQPRDAMVTIQKQLQTSEGARKYSSDRIFDSYDLRDDMEDAMKEYRIINQADFCGATSMEFSTFSQVSLSTGQCKYVDVLLGENCFSTNTSSSSLAKKISHNPSQDMIKKMSKKQQTERLYKSMQKKKVSHYFPCISTSNIEIFWKEAVQGKC